MKIETKFDCMDYVWFMYKNKPMLDIITNIKVSVDYISKRIFIEYSVNAPDTGYTRMENEIFATKEELIASL